jgi:Protein of unknown function (DUF1573)
VTFITIEFKIKKFLTMKNVTKGFAFVVGMAMMASCNTTPSATSSVDGSSMSASASSNTVAAPAPVQPATAQASAAAPSSVAPDASQMTPSAESAVNKSNGKMTVLKFDEMSYAWGKIKEGEKMTHNFKFTNTGTNDLIISDARGSCGCTVPEWPKEPIKAGKSGELKVIFDSKGKVGEQSKTVTVTANTEPSNTVIMIKGTVEAAAEEPKK